MSFEIRNYNQQIDKQAVIEIASANIEKLASVDFPLTKEKRREWVRAEIEPALENPSISKQVMAFNEKPVGFITYSVQNKSIYGRIHHLAIDKAYRNVKHGSSLLQFSLKSLKSQEVKIANLEITDESLIPFYQKHGFKVIKYPEIKMASAGVMGINLREQKGSLILRSLDFVRLRKPLFPKWAGSMGILGIIMVASISSNPHKKSQKED